MKTETAPRLVAIVTLMVFAACNKPSSDSPAKEAKITGKPSDPPVVLKAEWKPGNRYVMHMESTQTATIKLGPQPTVQETYVAQDYAVVVTNASDTHRGLDLEIQALVLNMQWGDREVYRFDSLNKVTPNEGPGVEMLHRVIGGHLGFLVDANNTVVKVDGIKELIERAQGDLGSNAKDQRRNWTGGILQRIYNADYFKQMIDLGALPGGAVRIGDTWTRQQEIDVGMVGRVVVSTTNVLRGWQARDGKQCARIEFSGVVGMKTGKPEGLLAFAGLSIQDGQVQGKCWFDPKIGLPMETTYEQSCTISGTLPGQGRRPNAPAGTNNAPTRFSSPWRQSVTLTLSDVQSAPAAPPKG